MSYGSSAEYEDAAVELLFDGKPDKALELFDEGLRRFPDDPGLILGKGMALKDLGRPDEARTLFLRLTDKHPDLTDALQGLAEAEIDLGNKKAAAEAARKACDRPEETNADFVHGLGLLLYRHGLYADAEHCYRRAVAIDRAHGLSWVGLASSLHLQGRRDEAIGLLKEAVEDRLPGFWEAYSYLGCLLCDAGRDAEAVKFLAKIPLDELRDPGAIKRLRAFLDERKYPERARVLKELEKRARKAQGEEEPKAPAAPAPAAPADLGTFIIGPVRGDHDGLLKILRHLQVVDGKGNWRGRLARIVAIGPLLGAKKAKLKALRYLQKLAKQAARTAGSVVLIPAPSDGEAAGEVCAICVGDEWLVTALGLSALVTEKAAQAVRTRWYGGGPWRPPFARELAKELAKPQYRDALDLSKTEPLKGVGCKGQIHGAGGEPDARAWLGGEVVRLDSGLGNGRRLLCLRRLDKQWSVVELPLAAERFKELKTWFAKTFGIGFPDRLEPDPETEPLNPDSDGLLAFSAAVDRKRVRLPVMPDLFEKAPPGTWLTGRWGYGSNSYAFYFVRKDARRQVFLRLFYGGVYGEPKRDAAAVRALILEYLAFEDWAERNLKRWRIQHNMGRFGGWVEYPDGRKEAVPREFPLGRRFKGETGSD